MRKIEEAVRFTSCGALIVWGMKVLLIHPTNDSDEAWNIPKGEIDDPKENHVDCAMREVEEEIGLKLNKAKLSGCKVHDLTFNSTRGGKKQLFCYVYFIDSPAEIGMKGNFVPKGKLQLEEVDQAKFFSLDDAYEKMDKRVRPLLDKVFS